LSGGAIGIDPSGDPPTAPQRAPGPSPTTIPSPLSAGAAANPAPGRGARGGRDAGGSRPLSGQVDELADVQVSEMHDLGSVLRVKDFRRLFGALALSSLGDWLGLLATTALAAALTRSNSSAQLYAIAGVLLVRLVPALIFGPFAGAFADRFDRRWTMIGSDVVRGGLFVLIPLFDRLWFLIVATFLIETFSLVWIPAKEASVPNLLLPEQLQTANQLSLIVTYGSAVPAAALFTLLSSLNRVLASGIGFFHSNPVDLALYFDGATFGVAALTVLGLTKISGRSPRAGREGDVQQVSLRRSIVEGWAYVGRTPLVRGLVIGILGAFGAGGVVIALSRPYVTLLHSGNAGYGLLFGDVFLGLALGFTVGPRILGDISRRRLFGMCITGAGASIMVVAVAPNLSLALVFVLSATTFAGIAWVTGYTLLGLEVPNELRGRTFGFVQSMIQVILFFTLAAGPALAGVIGKHHIPLRHGAYIRADGVTVVLLVGGMLAFGLGISSFRQMDDRLGVSLVRELAAAFHVAGPPPAAPAGFFVAFEGGEGAGKSTQLRLLAAALAERGYADVVVTHEPGATASGSVLRTLLLDPDTVLSPRAEALIYAADRAEHVHRVLRPALTQGSVVLSDRYVDSSLAYQGAGRAIDLDALRRVQRMATDGLRPDLTVLLDLSPEVGLERVGAVRDRIEAQPLAFHRAVRAQFLDLAGRDRGRYLVIDATEPPEQVSAEVVAEVTRRLDRLAAMRHVQRAEEEAEAAASSVPA
jgi:dTMP kinase